MPSMTATAQTLNLEKYSFRKHKHLRMAKFSNLIKSGEGRQPIAKEIVKKSS